MDTLYNNNTHSMNSSNNSSDLLQSFFWMDLNPPFRLAAIELLVAEARELIHRTCCWMAKYPQKLAISEKHVAMVERIAPP